MGHIGRSSIPLASFEGVGFAYDNDAVLADASFSIEAGECVALIGPNGSGKSTVAELLCALLVPDSGKVRVLGRDTSCIEDDAEMLELRGRIGYALQNPDNQFVEPMVADEVAFGPSNLSLPREEVLERVQDALQQTGSSELAHRNVNTLSGGEKQRITIADALAMRPDLLILDEPTSMLDLEGRQSVIGVIERAKRQGVAMLLLTHSIEEAALADRILRIEDKRIVPTSIEHMHHESDILRSELISSIVQRELLPNEVPKAPIVSIQDASFEYDPMRSRILGMFGGSDEEAADIVGEGCTLGSDEVARNRKGPALDSITLDVNAGETLAIRGPNGSGKSTLLQLMNGLLKPTSGRVLVGQEDTMTRSGANSARKTVGLCGQFPERSFFGQTAREEIGFGPANLGLSRAEVQSCVNEAADALGLDDRILDANPFELSGGEQRKVAIASIISMGPEVLALDEPCSGLDSQAHALVLKALSDLRANGATIVLASHDDYDIELLADRVYELS